MVNQDTVRKTGEFNFTKFANFLKSFWGILASFTIILPTLIYLIKTQQIKQSVLADYYIGIPTTFALLVIPFVFLFEDNLSILKNARKASLIFTILSFFTIVSFITIKSVFICNSKFTIYNVNEFTRDEYFQYDTGLIGIKTYKNKVGEPIKIIEKINVLELIALVTYSFSIITLTISFSILGVFFYNHSKDR